MGMATDRRRCRGVAGRNLIDGVDNRALRGRYRSLNQWVPGLQHPVVQPLAEVLRDPGQFRVIYAVVPLRGIEPQVKECLPRRVHVGPPENVSPTPGRTPSRSRSERTTLKRLGTRPAE